MTLRTLLAFPLRLYAFLGFARHLSSIMPRGARVPTKEEVMGWDGKAAWRDARVGEQ